MDQRQQDAATRRRPGPALLLTAGLVALFATGIGPRPAGAAWDRTYDVVLYNLPYLAAAAACVLAAHRVRTERILWAALAVALTLGAVGNALRVLSAGLEGNEPSSTLSHAVSFAAYLVMYLPLVVLIRTRVPRFHPSMWLDGVVAALGSLSAGVAFLLGPYLHTAPGETPVAAVDLAAPITTVLLIAMLMAISGILGVRLDRTFVLLGAGLALICVSDIVLFALKVQGTYVDGGPLELGWLASVVLTAAAADGAVERPAPVDAPGSRIGWRLLAVPLVCLVASLAVLSPGWSEPVPDIAGWLALGCVLAGVVRIAVTFREVRGYNQVKLESRTDELTGLANRRSLLERAKRVVAAARRDRPAALLLLDLDGFKEINDSLGHSAGDDLLRQIGPRLRGSLRSGDVLARLGGDEFAVLMPAAEPGEARALAWRLSDLLHAPFTVADVRLHVGVSIGVATTPAPATTVQELLHCADVAMYSAKRARERVHVYVPDPVTGTAGSGRLRTMEELRTALDGDELRVFLQPQMDLRDGRIVGAEALVRWEHPTRGLLSPADFLPAAEQAGLMRPLTDRVIELALAAAGRWWPDRAIPVSVNLSAANVTDLDLAAKVATALHRHGLPPAALTLELVEDTLMADPERGRGVLAELRCSGVRTSIDDYGTGYSSLAYLRHLPADELKLDRSLTADADRDPRAAAIVQSTVALAHALGLSLVAEGVETLAMSATLAHLGCDVAQGYAIARPMPVDDFLRWLDASDSGLVDATLIPQLHRGPSQG
ncbi:putative bifunctional diguanylate cyclase/phosphodiesterase [Blastococcus sp. VKM Ac-2987]|uniref:putative bifunctional diguanylate cyclase/phosphodiesterase n=1 Tax=Blastococcus sp. VKM Ac-2987 TaxID=3004141 RepID=UPI0022AB596A|nr:bifunctional diguanylate cyclase/phosphodiesterase [Blastococcus sp. VKM Ac-2987]MCZ2858484.1 bifunctional diguanylate cyclase/phosphodiesterase [Blastococcus sp. VKM Ac-2987]